MNSTRICETKYGKFKVTCHVVYGDTDSCFFKFEIIDMEGNKIIGKKALEISILYGGSVNPNNSKDILDLSDVDGALVGGASLKSKDFCKIIDSSN